MVARIGTITWLAVAALLIPAVASASPKANPSCTAAVCQYVESIPTSSGSVTPGVQKEKQKPLSKHTESVLNNTSSRSQAQTLKRITKSSLFGAQTNKLTHKKVASAKIDPSVSSSLSRALGSPGSGSSDRLLGLLAVVIVITGVFVVFAARKQRSRS